MGKDNKIEKTINQDELPDFLRKIAAALENGASDDIAYLAGIEDFKKLKINIRNEYGQTSIKIKAKPPKVEPQLSNEQKTSDQNSGEDIAAKPKYSLLKKRMRSSFKIIFKALHGGEMPPSEAVEEFIADSHLMVSYTGKGYGDEYYDEYIATCEIFKNAFESGDIESTHKACDELNNIKAHCHSKYD